MPVAPLGEQAEGTKSTIDLDVVVGAANGGDTVTSFTGQHSHQSSSLHRSGDTCGSLTALLMEKKDWEMAKRMFHHVFQRSPHTLTFFVTEICKWPRLHAQAYVHTSVRLFESKILS
jgi:hypothetical protein